MRSVAVLVFTIVAMSGTLEAQVTFEIGSVTAAPGQADASVPFSILLEPGTEPVQAWSVAIQYDPAVMADVRIESVRETDCFLSYRQEFFYGPGIAGAAFGYLSPIPDPDPQHGVTHDDLCPDLDPKMYVRESGVVGSIRFCVLPGAPAGIHVIGYALSGGGPERICVNHQYGPRASGEGTKTPRLLAGFVEVAGEKATGSACEPDVNENSWPPDPVPYTASCRLEDGTAQRGGDLAVPLYMQASVDVGGFQISIDFDEEVLEATDIERVLRRSDGKDWDFYDLEYDNSNRIPGSHGIEEGFVVGGAVFNLRTSLVVLPADTEAEVLRLHFRVRPEAPLGETLIRFVDGAAPIGDPPIGNFVGGGGWGIPPGPVTSQVFVTGRINVLPDGALFVRGDSNGDSEVDLADAETTLGYLFLGGSLWCQKAADANDDGRIDLTDPVVTLMRLYLGGDPLPSPDEPGSDPTPDGLEDCPRS